jgi:hypothetical protein
MVIKNISDNDLNFSFDFRTYSIPKNKPLTVPEKVAEFLSERWPKSFEFNLEGKKTTPLVKSMPSKSFIAKEAVVKNPESTMQAGLSHEQPTFGAVDNLPMSGTTDKDGVEWVGEGLTYE